MRTRLPSRITPPSTTPSTESSLAISGSFFFVPFIASLRMKGDYPQCGNLAEVVDQFFGHAIGKILLRRVARQVFKRQDRDRSESPTREEVRPAISLLHDQDGNDADRG